MFDQFVHLFVRFLISLFVQICLFARPFISWKEFVDIIHSTTLRNKTVDKFCVINSWTNFFDKFRQQIRHWIHATNLLDKFVTQTFATYSLNKSVWWICSTNLLDKCIQQFCSNNLCDKFVQRICSVNLYNKVFAQSHQTTLLYNLFNEFCKFVRWIFVTYLFGEFVWRICSTNSSDKFKHISWTAALVSLHS